MQEYFHKVVDYLKNSVQSPRETFTVYYEGESSDFARFNHNRIRQAGNVEQHYLSMRIIDKKNRHAEHNVTLSLDWAEDKLRLEKGLQTLRSYLKILPEDPFFISKESVNSTEDFRGQMLPPCREMVDQIQDLAQDLDLVGILASGMIYRAYGDSEGQVNWFETSSVHFDWSVYHSADKAIKDSLAGVAWNGQELAHKMTAIRQRLPLLQQTPKRIQPGQYRVYLAPTALCEFWELLAWGGFSGQALQTKNSALQALSDGKVQLDSRVNVSENTASGVSPQFNALGFIRPPTVPLIAEGQFKNGLVSPRTAREFGLAGNAANNSESPVALNMAGGQLPSEEVLSSLGTGLYIGNLWYLNYSDLDSCRMTGMTRFATFWVEGGQLKQPVDVMRFDESFYRLLGDSLIDLTRETSLLISSSTYQSRSTNSLRLPGALVDGFRLTL